ncbi:uncharacterized protein BCR38DRAFT_429073 [Pseudomassariella vexata]|uniref:Uncharacterized protein n=1 Tax=Pseudomassariella vexata TaxID=1141098 RepID=A0A1Y2E3A9_9PEZI|nr:uncharacterized protein BCR38DRAFT_429073 [Pseudomassariella vexata]ORY66041.1 hypothetical protein BCR38DRAFT_429073 [Pseudomassariella vexata]
MLDGAMLALYHIDGLLNRLPVGMTVEGTGGMADWTAGALAYGLVGTMMGSISSPPKCSAATVCCILPFHL